MEIKKSSSSNDVTQYPSIHTDSRVCGAFKMLSYGGKESLLMEMYHNMSMYVDSMCNDENNNENNSSKPL
jgi:hypothetical protein